MVSFRMCLLCAPAVVAANECVVGEVVQCPYSGEHCQGGMCCPDGSTCPSAQADFVRCGRAREHACRDTAEPTWSHSSTACSVGDNVQCPGSTAWCAGNQCCPDGSTCPSAHSHFNACSSGKVDDCISGAPSPPPGPAPTPSGGMGFCGVASTIPSVNEAEWGPLFANANINWFWNWDIQVARDQYIPQGWHFVPNLWGSGSFPLNPGITSHHGPGATSYEIVDILLGWNEPDIVGLCISQPEIASPADGWCQTAGSMGWWFPDLITNPTLMMADWYTQVDDSTNKGYRVATPMVAVGTGSTWLKPFVDAACSEGRCPRFLTWHFYSMGCHDEDSYLDGFRQKMDDSLSLMKSYSSIEGVLITEAGTLALEDDGSQAATTCPDSVLVTVMRKMFAIMRDPKYVLNGRSIVSHFSWFSQDGTGATYSLSLVDPQSGAVRALGQAYAEECSQMSLTNMVV